MCFVFIQDDVMVKTAFILFCALDKKGKDLFVVEGNAGLRVVTHLIA